MRYQGIVPQAVRQKLIASIQRAGESIGLKSGFVDDARRRETPHVVDCHNLSREIIGDRAFEKHFVARRDWCLDRCPADHEIEPIRDDQMRLTGRRFRFANDADATSFKAIF